VVVIAHLSTADTATTASSVASGKDIREFVIGRDGRIAWRGFGNSLSIDDVRDEVKKPLVCLTPIEPESGLHVEIVMLKLIDEPGHVIDLVFYQRCLIHGSTPCAASVIAAMSFWAP